MNYTLDELDKMEGHDFEYAVADLLRYNGYRDVEVTQGSGDYGIDILARRKNVKYAIQCKRYNSSVGVKAVREAGSGAEYYGCDMAAVITNSTFTKQAINMAETIGVRLCDRSFLSELIENYDEGYDEIYAPELHEKRISTKENIINQNMQKNVVSAKEDSHKKPNIVSNQKIELAKGVYYQNGKIIFNNRKHTYKEAKQDRIIMLIMAWFIIILLGVLVFAGVTNIFIIVLGLWGGIYCLVCCKKIKKALQKYDILKHNKEI
jgi:predicted RecB family endonuclease